MKINIRKEIIIVDWSVGRSTVYLTGSYVILAQFLFIICVSIIFSVRSQFAYVNLDVLRKARARSLALIHSHTYRCKPSTYIDAIFYFFFPFIGSIFGINKTARIHNVSREMMCKSMLNMH